MFLWLAHLRKRKNQSRGRPTHFIFRVQLLEIKPWLPSKQPSGTSPPFSAILRWHRGGHRSGFAHSGIAYPASCGGKVPFNHVFEIPVTLYCSSSSAFEEKLIIFTLHDGKYSSGPPLARGILNLAAYHASGVDNDQPSTTTACIPLILCGHVASRAVIPNLHIVITSSLCKRACFGEGNCQSKAQRFVSHLPRPSVRLLRKSETFQPPLDHRSHAELVADLLKEEDEEHEEEEKEAEIEAFTDDESSSGLRTPPEDNSSTLHYKKNTTSIEDSGSLPASSRISVAQVAWTPTPKRPYSDELLSSLKTSSEFYSLSEEAFFTSSHGVSPTNNQTSPDTSPLPPSFASTGKQTRLDNIKLHSDNQKPVGPNDERTTHTKTSTIQVIPLLHQDVDAGEGQLAGGGSRKSKDIEHIISSSELTDLKSESYPEDNNDQVSEVKALRHRIISQLRESKVWRTDLDNLDSEWMEDDDIISVEEDMNVLEEARRKFAEGAEKRDAKITKRLLEESKVKLAEAEAKLFAASEKVCYLQLCIGAREGELQDVAAIEMIIFCTVSEHGGSPHSVLTCASHLAKLHNHALTNWSHQRRASLMRSTLSGLILATRACGQDVARLTFWWSNVLALRHAFMLALNPLARPSSSETARNPGHVVLDGAEGSGHTDCTIGSESCDWSDPTIFGAALEKVEAWICARVVESTWWQVFAPLTQKSTCPLESLNKDDAVTNENQESTSIMFDLEDRMQQNTSIDIWKNAFLDALQKLCPVRVGGKECSCIPGLPKLVIEECIYRLDALMFNAILPVPYMESPSNLVSEAQFEAQVLPILPGHLTFGAGVQLKNVVGTWSTWLTILLEKLSNTVTNAVAMDDSRQFLSFPLLKALADLLMLPRDMVADKSVRKEVCPVLTLPVVRRIISSVEPDDFAPDAVSPSLLAALTAEIDMEKRMYGDEVEHVFSAAGVAFKPRVAYCPQTTTFKDLAGSMLDCVVSEWIRQDSDVNDVLFFLQTLLSESLQACSEIWSGTSDYTVQARDVQEQRDCRVLLHRYKLLQELWATESTGSPSLDV